jgi:hypothetical protein
MPNLHVLTAEYLNLVDLLADPEVAESPEFEAQVLASIEQAADGFNAKVENLALVIDELDQHADNLDGLAKGYASRARSAKRNVEFLKGWLLRAMTAAGIQKVKGDRATVSVSKNSAAPLWTREGLGLDEIPEEFVRVEKSLNSTAVREALKAGESFEWAKLLPPGEHVRVRVG